jgi:hypothetical protein
VGPQLLSTPSAWCPLFNCITLPVPVRFMMVRTSRYSPVICCSSSWEPTKVVGGEMDAVARKAQRSIVKLHPKDVTGETMFVDVGMLPPSLTIGLTNLVWLKGIQQLSGGTIAFAEQHFFGRDSRRGALENRNKLVSSSGQNSFNIKHNLNIEFPH